MYATLIQSILGALFLAAQSADPVVQEAERSVEDLLWVSVSAVITGLVVLIGFVAVHRRFLNHEFPMVLSSMERQERALEKIRTEMHQMALQIATQGAVVAQHEQRISIVETHANHSRHKP